MEQENFDFYQEALKAFDAPIPQPKKEEPAPEPVAEVTESTPQEKPKGKVNPWWIMALCALLCLALLIGFGGKTKNTARGENCVFGTVLEYGEGYATVATVNGNWYVEMEGMEMPTDASGVQLQQSQPIWVFYNGEPEETDQNGCVYKVAATFWKTDAELYTALDEIEFDLDGDGRKEIWSMHYARLLPLYGGNFICRVSLTAKDSQGNVLQDVYLTPREAMGVAFNNAEGKLSLVLYNNGVYSAMELRTEEGVLAVYRNGQKQMLFAATDVQQTEPPITEPIITDPPGTLPVEQCSIQFFLDGDFVQIPATALQVMTAAEGRALKGQLDSLQWADRLDVLYETAGWFVFELGAQQYHYAFTNDGLLIHEYKVAKLSAHMKQSLLERMGWTEPDSQLYQANLENGATLSITFYNSGTLRLQLYTDYYDREPDTYLGRYATFGKYYYLVLGEHLDNVMVMRLGDAALQYIDVMSSQSMFQFEDETRFYSNQLGGSFALVLRNADGTYANRNELSTLTVWENTDLRRQLKRRTWNTLEHFSEDQVLGCFTIYDGTGSDISHAESYYLLTGCRLYKSNANQYSYITADDQALWLMLCAAMQKQSYPLEASFGGVNQDGMKLELQMMVDGNYQYSVQLKQEGIGTHVYSSGSSYVRLGDCMVLLGWRDGPSYVHLDIQGDRLVYDAARSTPDLAFSQTKEAILYNLQVNLHRTVNLEITMPDGESENMITYQRSYVILPEQLAKELSLILNSVQWVEPGHWSGGNSLGTIHFVESMDAPVEIYSGMRLVRGCYEAKLTQSQWETICQVMSEGSGIVYASATASEDGEIYALTLSGNRMFTLAHQLEQNRVELVYGTYSLLDNDLLLCYGFSGDVFILRMEEGGWRLLPDHNGITSMDIPGGTIFIDPNIDTPLWEYDQPPAN